MNFLKKRKLKNKNCIIHYEQDVFSNIAKIDIYGSNFDVKTAIERGNTIEDVREKSKIRLGRYYNECRTTSL